MSEMTWRPGEFVWREIHIRDGEAARAFYGALFGWTFEKGPFPEMPYYMINGPTGTMGGMMQIGADEPMPTVWMTYISVANVDEAADRAKAAGGSLLVPPTDIPHVGRFALMADPAGAVSGILWQSNGDGPRGDRPPTGAFCWETINSTNVDAAKAFYPQVVGWTLTEGGMPVFAAGETQVCDLEAAPPGMPSNFLSHVVVEDLEASRAKMESLGGRSLMPRVDIPNIGSICVFADPQGAVLSMFQPGN